MADFPQVAAQYFQERSGVIAFAQLVNSLRFVWRETPNADVGIDGQIEFVDSEGNATGQIVAVQVKTGPSYLRAGDQQFIEYRPAKKHLHYWREFAVPVLLVIYDPETGAAYWLDARQALRSPMNANVEVLRIPRTRTLSRANRTDLFQSAGALGESVLTTEDVLLNLARTLHPDPGFNISCFELFGFGIMDVGRKLIFSMGLCMELAEIRSEAAGVGWSVGATEHDFIDAYIRFLVAQNLVYYDYSDYLIDRDQLEIAPIFIVPLTHRGRQVLRLMQSMSDGLFYEATLEFSMHYRLRLPARLRVAHELQGKLLAKAKEA